MSAPTENKILVKMFVGCYLNSEIRMYLNESKTWKQAAILRTKDKELIEVHFQNKDYIGKYLESETINLDQLKKSEKEVRETLKRYVCDCDSDSLKICVFPQLFIA